MKPAAALAAVALLFVAPLFAAAVEGGPIPVPLPLFPATNWWNAEVTSAPIDGDSANYIGFINLSGTGTPKVRHLHPDFGGDVSAGSVDIYGFPYILVNGNTQAKKT